MSQLSRRHTEVELLALAAGITDGAADIDAALKRLAGLLVPDLADAAWIDVLDPGGNLRRVAACVDGPDAEELEAWLMARGAMERAEHSPTTRALRGEGPQLAELDGGLRAAMIHDDDDAALLTRSGLRSTIAIPLEHQGDILGALGMGLGPSGRSYGPAELAFVELLAGRATLALANAQLVAILTATQRRLDGILNTLAEAVSVHDGEGRLVYGNPALAELLGFPDVEELMATPPEEIFARFDIRDATGRRVPPEELPGARAIAGEVPEPMLTRTTNLRTGRTHWLVTKARPLVDETGATLAVNVIEDHSQERAAYAQLAEVADVLQASLLPDALPGIAGWELAAHYRPGQHGALVGGDFYDVFEVQDGHLLLLGDVTGKGAAAASVTALVRHTARTAARFDPRPAAVLALVDRTLSERPQRAPVTMLCGLLCGDELTIAAGGHPLPLLRRDSEVSEIGRTGVLLGAIDRPRERPEATVTLVPGDALLLYTDGVTETPGTGERFGEERLHAALAAAPGTAEALLDAVTARLDTFARGDVLDDRALLALCRQASASRT